MAKKKSAKAQLPPARPDDDDDDDLVPELEQPGAVVPASAPADEGDAVAELADAFAELGEISGATITVNRVNDRGKEEWLDRFSAREFDLYSIRDRYGPGTYTLYGHDGKQLRKKGRIIVGCTLDEQRMQQAARSGAALTPASSNDTLFQLQQQMLQQQRENMQLLVTALSSNRAPAMDPMVVISAAEKLANLGSRGGGDFDALMKGVELARKLGGDGGGGSFVGEALAELVRALREAPQPPSSQLQLPAPAGTAGTASSSQPSNGDSQMMLMIRRALAERLPILIRGAQAESDPGVYAQLVLDQIPDLYIAPLVQQLQKADWFDLLVKVDGRVVPHQPWFEALRNEILQATSQESPPPA